MDPVALRGVARRQSGARSAGHGRIGARRLRQVSGLALDRLAQCRRLYRRCRRDPNPVFAEARLARLRHPGGGGDEQPRLHQYGADRALSRRRPARGRLHHGAAGRPGGARDAHRSGRAAQKEPDPADAYPYETRTGWVYDTGNYAAALAKCQALADWAGYAARRARSEAAGKHRGRSITYYVDNTGVFNERMELRFDPSGEVTIVAGTLSHGQGHETSYAQMVADWRGVPEDKIHLKQADTDEVAIGRGTYASRSMMIGVSALRAAADEVIERGKRFAAHLMEADAADIAFCRRRLHDRRHRPLDADWPNRADVVHPGRPALGARRRPAGRRRLLLRHAELSQSLPYLRSRDRPRDRRGRARSLHRRRRLRHGHQPLIGE